MKRDTPDPFDHLINALQILISHNHSFDLMSSILFRKRGLRAKTPGQNGDPEGLFPFVEGRKTVF
jgi:hypothetical protein